MIQGHIQKPEQLLINEVQLLLAEKRTYFSVLRTGIAISTLPLSIVVFLLATIKYHHLFDYSFTMIPLIGTLFLISFIGMYISHQANSKLRRIDALIKAIKRENKRMAEIIL
ncbi:MAG: hypothetical protein HZA36_03520 [Parcubacteria group bacterium]|nr:hypothetical protein [Parcubacteria group bacterium]